jgi:hypothetical protein
MTVYLGDLDPAFQAIGDGKLRDGEYSATVLRAEVGYSKGGKRQVKLDFEIKYSETGGVFIVQKYYSLEPEFLCYLKRALNTLHIAIGFIDQLPDVLHGMIGSKVHIYYENSGDWYNIVIIDRLIFDLEPTTRYRI